MKRRNASSRQSMQAKYVVRCKNIILAFASKVLLQRTHLELKTNTRYAIVGTSYGLVRLRVRLSVRPSMRPSVHPSVRPCERACANSRVSALWAPSWHRVLCSLRCVWLAFVSR
jgi:hypothetical protein